MDLSELKMLLHPNAVPVEKPNREQWLDAEAKLGLMFPADYKLFINHYGTGVVAKFLRLLNPISKIPRANLDYAARNDDFDGYHTLREMFPEQYPYPRYPEKEGLLPWGNTIDGDILYWLSQGAPETWPIIVWHRGLRCFHRFDTNVTQFLGSLVVGETHKGLFPANISFREGLYVVAKPKSLA